MSHMVLVRWMDIVSFDGAWASGDDAAELKPSLMLTLGWLVSESESHITLAGSRCDDDDDTLGDLNAIPRGCIVSTTAVEEVAV